MAKLDKFDYRGKRAVVVGGATGMGAAVAETVLDMGGEVVVMDKFKIALGGVQAISLDLAEKASIDRAIAACGGRVDALFSCAGVADGTPGIERINFIGHRYMIDRFFAAGMFLFLRLLPAVSISELKTLIPEAEITVKHEAEVHS